MVVSLRSVKKFKSEILLLIFIGISVNIVFYFISTSITFYISPMIVGVIGGFLISKSKKKFNIFPIVLSIVVMSLFYTIVAVMFILFMPENVWGFFLSEMKKHDSMIESLPSSKVKYLLILGLLSGFLYISVVGSVIGIVGGYLGKWVYHKMKGKV